MRKRNLALAGFLVLGASSVSAASPESFQVRSAQDLVALCSVSANDPNYVAAIHFCHGFAVGAYRYYQAATAGAPEERFVCPPHPPPSRTEAIGHFVAWMNAHPERMNDDAVDAMFRYLGETYPCRR